MVASGMSMSDVRVSVIIPVYNSAEYLGECLDSVVSQSLRETEIIIVNDCSSDGSQAIIDEYAHMDNRIHAIALEDNKGVSFARNAGIEVASGEYIIFVDSDDYWTDSGMLEFLYGLAKRESPDLIEFGYFNVGSNGQRAIKVMHRPRTIDLRRSHDWTFIYTPWTLLISRKLVSQHGIYFDPVLVVGEDALFNCMLYCHASRLTYTDKVYYGYRHKRPGCARVGGWNSHRLFCTVLWLKSAIKTVTGNPVSGYHHMLLHMIICQRLERLTNNYAFLALQLFNAAELREYIKLWADCFDYLNSEFIERFALPDRSVFPGEQPESYRKTLELVKAVDLEGFREYFGNRLKPPDTELGSSIS